MSFGTLTAPSPAPAGRMRRRSRTSLGAHGEPMVWLTGGALGVALAMIIGLLSFVVAEGVATFWPMPLVQLTTLEGRVLLGEVTRSETYRPEEQAFESLEPVVAQRARAAVEDAGGIARRRLLRTENFEITGGHFQEVGDFLVAAEERPEWALVVERLEQGRFYGFPKEFRIDGTTVASAPETVWAKFHEQHAEARRLWFRRKALGDELGRVNRELDNARLDVVGAALRYGATSRERERAALRHTHVEAEADARSDELRRAIAELDRANERFELTVQGTEGDPIAVPLAKVVRAYPANRLNWPSKLGIYLSRWWEFLADEPREANSEGGVFPAIFGTVVMTLVMTLAVVPFGVLAALYLREYSKGGVVVSAVRIAINNLAGVPSIVFGVFGLGFFCYGVGGFIDGGPSDPLSPKRWFVLLASSLVVLASAAALSAASTRPGAVRQRVLSNAALCCWLLAAALTVCVLAKTPYFHGFYAARLADGNNPTYGKGGLAWASLTLALLTLPVVIVATEEALAAVPRSMREGSYACGASKWQTIWRIVLPRAMPGIMTGMILAMARGAGEVAPLMLVGALKDAPDLPLDSTAPFLHPERSFMHLGFHIFDLGFQSPNSEAAKPMVFTTTLLLITIIAFLNLAAVWMRIRLSRRFETSQF
jgi:ABC-type phosphate transport system permease subunit